MSRAIEQVFGTDPNDPTFPVTVNDGERNHVFTGLSKREHFAGLAMQGLIATGKYADVHSFDCASIGATAVGKRAVLCADALIAELAKAKP